MPDSTVMADFYLKTIKKRSESVFTGRNCPYCASDNQGLNYYYLYISPPIFIICRTFLQMSIHSLPADSHPTRSEFSSFRNNLIGNCLLPPRSIPIEISPVLKDLITVISHRSLRNQESRNLSPLTLNPRSAMLQI